MSFPPMIGDTGESPARGFVLGPDDGDAYWWLGSLTLTKVGRDAARGAMDIAGHC